mgnify:CR=1 FL=1
MSRKQKVAFLHGWGLNRQIWLDIICRINQEHPHIECQLLNLPGYGGVADIETRTLYKGVVPFIALQIMMMGFKVF